MQVVMCVCFSSILLVLGTWSRAAADQSPRQPDGAALYKKRCQMCHAADGKGFKAIKSQDFTDPKWQASVKDKELRDVIKNGKKGTTMPAFADKLKDDEIQALMRHLRTFHSRKNK